MILARDVKSSLRKMMKKMRDKANNLHPFKAELMSNEDIQAIMKKEFDPTTAAPKTVEADYPYFQVNDLYPTVARESITQLLIEAGQSKSPFLLVTSRSA